MKHVAPRHDLRDVDRPEGRAADADFDPRAEEAPDGSMATEKSLKRVFIVGFPRNGTTFTMWLLAQLPSVVAIQQSGMFHALQEFERWWMRDHAFSRGDAGEAGGESDRRQAASRAGARSFYGTTEVLAPSAYYELLRPLCAHVFERVAAATPDARVVVEQTPENMEFEDTIRQVFPDAYFLEVVRDPRDALCSMRRAAVAWDNEFPGRPIHIARRWLKFRRHARSLAAGARHHMQVRYEDLVADGPAQLARIAEWLGEPVDLDTCRRAVEACSFERMRAQSTMPAAFFHKGRPGTWRESLSSSDQRLVEYLFGEEMVRLGYPREHPRAGKKPFRLALHDLLAKNYGRFRWWTLFGTRRLRRSFEHRVWELRFTDQHRDAAGRD